MAKEKLSFKPRQQEAGSRPPWLSQLGWLLYAQQFCLNENPVEDFKDASPLYCIALIWGLHFIMRFYLKFFGYKKAEDTNSPLSVLPWPPPKELRGSGLLIF